MMARSSSQYFCRAGIRRRRRPSFNLPCCEPRSIRHALVVLPCRPDKLACRCPQALAAEDYAVLIISRERLEVPTYCEIGLYIQDQLAGRLFQEQATSFNLPRRYVAAPEAFAGQAAGCLPGLLAPRAQNITLKAGDVRKLRIAQGPDGMYLKAAALNTEGA